MVADLGEVTYQDIKIKLFQVQIDGYTFGLIPDEEEERVHVQPSVLKSLGMVNITLNSRLKAFQ
ncbi:hypothetical protein QE357_002003 [Siphonobacter sp. BAB-5404]|nr:hypothetical protein [Siphonobacter sp. SORGH_AS_0500]